MTAIGIAIVGVIGLALGYVCGFFGHERRDRRRCAKRIKELRESRKQVQDSLYAVDRLPAAAFIDYCPLALRSEADESLRRAQQLLNDSEIFLTERRVAESDRRLRRAEELIMEAGATALQRRRLRQFTGEANANLVALTREMEEVLAVLPDCLSEGDGRIGQISQLAHGLRVNAPQANDAPLEALRRLTAQARRLADILRGQTEMTRSN